MTKFLLSAHVLVAILAVGSIAVAASMFPRYAKQAVTEHGQAVGIATTLHKICRGYAIAGLAVPALGIATGAALGALRDAWLVVSLILTILAAALLGLWILPYQQRMLAMARTVPGTETTLTEAGLTKTTARLHMLTGIFNLLWAVVVVLMIVRPGSTTSA
ncbi:hypothetical protein ACFYVL_07280 [Streptomyces sp. NPDC004111]|uniref:hypothetical protein n=1 Tax=Streptomyces sp. NPDC004111 TaxID=3364690 RepID=UPI0036B24C46